MLSSSTLRPVTAWTTRQFRHQLTTASTYSTTGKSMIRPVTAIHGDRFHFSTLRPEFSCNNLRYSKKTYSVGTKRFMVSNELGGDVRFRPGDKIQVEVVSFGPLGASVEVIGLGHGDNVPLLPADAPEAYGYGLILQKEISYFRKARRNVDVVRGEILPAYVQKVREVDGKLDISLRTYGGKAKSMDAGTKILERLEESGGRLDIGEKSSPEEINEEFPGVSKGVFKKALGGLYKKGLVKPGPKSIELMKR